MINDEDADAKIHSKRSLDRAYDGTVQTTKKFQLPVQIAFERQ